MRADRARRRALRPWRLRLESERDGPCRRTPRLGWSPAGRDQARDRGPGGGRRRRPDELHALAPRRFPLGRDDHRRCRQRPAGRPDAHDRPSRHGPARDRGQHARGCEAQRPVRRGCARRPGGSHPGSCGSPRRERRCRRPGVAARGVVGHGLQRRGVPRSCRDQRWPAVPGNRRPRLTTLVRPGDHRHRDRRSLGRERLERSAAACRRPGSTCGFILLRTQRRRRPPW